MGVRVNTSIGISDKIAYYSEVEKIKKIGSFEEIPDIMMDLSIIESSKPLYKVIEEEIGCPVGTIPYYTCFDENTGINERKLIEKIERLANEGISFLTLHFTGTQEMLNNSKKRKSKIFINS